MGSEGALEAVSDDGEEVDIRLRTPEGVEPHVGKGMSADHGGFRPCV